MAAQDFRTCRGTMMSLASPMTVSLAVSSLRRHPPARRDLASDARSSSAEEPERFALPPDSCAVSSMHITSIPQVQFQVHHPCAGHPLHPTFPLGTGASLTENTRRDPQRQETRTGVLQESPLWLISPTSVLIHFIVLALSHPHFLLLSAAAHGYVTNLSWMAPPG